MSQSSSRAVMSRILLGVTSIGAAFGLIYLLYNNRKKNDSGSDGGSTSSISKKKKRVISGERNRVTFSDQNEILGINSSPVSSKEELEEQFEKVPKVEIKISSPPKKEDNESRSQQCSKEATQKNQSIASPQPKEIETNKSSDDTKNENSSSLVKLSKEEHVNKNKSSADVVNPVVIGGDVVDASVEKQPDKTSASTSKENGHEIKQSITPETDYDRTSITRELRISRDHVPSLIGRKGSTIKSIQQSSNTIINFKDETLENGDRVCLIRGQSHDVTVAESLIEKHIMDLPVITSQTMHVPHSSVGRIIGKGGESIRTIQDFSKAKVIVDTANQFHARADAGRSVLITLRGTEQQINVAKEMIIEKVEEEKTLRRNIDIVTQSRTPRRTNSGSPNPPGPSANNSQSVNGNHTIPSGKTTLECFVSCAYHCNDFYMQVMGRESIELDKLTERMTEWYNQLQQPEELRLSVGEIIAAPFDVDGKMYRGKILKLENGMAEVSYLDYGDKRIILQSEVRRIHPEFLKLRYQAFPATLNLGCIGERWSDEAIAKFCDLTYCAMWQSLTAKVKDYLKSTTDPNQTILLVELFDKDLNVGDELIRLGFASNDTLPALTAENPSVPSTSNNGNKKSYASVVVAHDTVVEDGNRNDNFNGN